MSFFSTGDKDHLEQLWARYREGGFTEVGPSGPDGATGPSGDVGASGAAGADGDDIGVVVHNDAEMAAALADLHKKTDGSGGTINVADGNYFQDVNIYVDNIKISGAQGAVLRPPDKKNGITLHSVNHCTVTGMTVKDTTYDGPGEVAGIKVRGGSFCLITNNTLLNNDDAGISIQYDSDRLQRYSPEEWKDYDLMYEIDGHHHLVSNNAVSSTREGAGIELMRCNDTVCSGNVIKETSQHGIRILGTSGCVITNNKIDEAGTGGTTQNGGIFIGAFGGVLGVTKKVSNTIVANNNVKSYLPIVTWAGVLDTIISDNIFECITQDGGVGFRSKWIPGLIKDWDYDMSRVSIVENHFLNAQTCIFLENDIRGLIIEGNTFADFTHAGVHYDQGASSSVATGEEIYVKNNVFRCSEDDTIPSKYGIISEGSGSDLHVFGNDHFPGSESGYTYADEWEVSSGTITTIDYSGLIERSLVDGEPNGFPNRTDSTLAFDDGTRTFTIAPAVTSFDVWVEGLKYTKSSAQTVVIHDTEGEWFFYFDNTGTLIASQTFDVDVMAVNALCAVTYWDATNNESLGLGEERHGLVMDGRTHAYLHMTRGTAVESGLGLGDIDADASGNDATSAQLSTAAGIIWDEDIRLDIDAQSLPANIPVLYKEGAAGEWRIEAATDYPVKSFVGGGGRLAYNEFTGGAWQQTELGNLQLMLAHIFASNSSSSPQYVSIQGENTYNTVANARIGATEEISALVTAGLPIAEFAVVGTVIFQTGNTYSNTPKARIRTTDEGDDYVSWVDVPLSPTSGPANHNNLLNIGVYTHEELDAWVDGGGGGGGSLPSVEIDCGTITAPGTTDIDCGSMA